MPCDLEITKLNACESGIGKLDNPISLLQIIAQLSCEIADAGGGGGGGTPGGAASSVQFNDAGAFGGFGSFNSGTSVLTIPGDLLFNTDNSDDIGASGASRPRTGYFGTSVATPIVNVNDGTAAAPTVKFGAVQTGWFRDSAGTGGLGMATGGTQRMLFWSNNIWIQSDVGNYSWGVGQDLILTRDAAQTLAQRNGTNAQILRVYRTFTNSTNYERLTLQSAANEMIVAAETAGTGGDNIDLGLTAAGTGRVKINTALNTAVDGGLTAAFTANMVGSTGGPTTAAQNGWLLLKDSAGANIWVPVWK